MVGLFLMCVCVCPLQQVDYLTGQYATAKNKVLSELDSKLTPIRVFV